MTVQMEQDSAKTVPSAQKANECITSVKHFRWPQMLFDEFWRENELALLFGPPGVGKSLFSVQLAETLARGRKIGTFRMPGYKRRTLFVDLVMSPAKFRLRYSYFPPGGTREARAYKFSQSLFRERPAAGEHIETWLRQRISDDRIEVVIIDDLAALRRSDDGTAESLRVMREFKDIVDELRVSILVLASSALPAKGALVDESNLRRTRAVCNVVDGVFAMCYHPRSPGSRYFIQTRSRNAEAVWNGLNAPVCRIGRTEEMLLSFIFDDRFTVKLDPELQRTICLIKAAKDSGWPFRRIAEDLQIPVSRARRLFLKWTPDMGHLDLATIEPRVGGPHLSEDSTPTENEHEQTRDHRDHDNAEDRDDQSDEAYEREIFGTQSCEPDVTNIPFAAGLRRRTIYDLDVAINAYDREIYVEKWDKTTGKPEIWYEINEQGILTKNVRGLVSITVTRVGKTHFL